MESRLSNRILAISDIHGQASLLIRLLEQASYDPAADRLVVCGDLVDRGGENLAALEKAQSLKNGGAIILKGNHEQFLENGLREMIENRDWSERPSMELLLWHQCNGGERTLRELAKLPPSRLAALLLFIQSLPAYAEIDDFIFAHAGCNPSKVLEEQTETDFVWASRDFYAAPAYAGKTVVFGHTPTFCLPGARSKPAAARIWHDQTHKDKICIDCGCVYGGRLACLELPSLREFYV